MYDRSSWGFCKWAFKEIKVKVITAETAKDNPASFKVLEKNNFVKFDENDNFITGNW
jgi:RimJ/RimL family protein N-acetyltransferase